MSTSSPGLSQLSLARFASNIYGSLNERPALRVPGKPRLLPPRKLSYACDREITCVTQLDHPLARLGPPLHDAAAAPAHHVVIGGKNYLKLLALDAAQTAIVADFSLVDTHALLLLLRLHASLRLFNVNTIKTKNDLVACGLTSGTVHVYQLAGNGRARLLHRLDDHKRVVNSLDFVEHEHVLFSGSQDGSVRLWDLRAYGPKPVAKLMASQHADPVRSCQFSPHARVRGKMAVLSVHDSGALCKFDLRYPAASAAGLTLPERKWTFHTGPALSLHIHPELEYVLTGGRDRRICLWNYGDAAPHSAAPDTSLNTYGPVMKLRWNETPSAEHAPPGPLDMHDDWRPDRQALQSYDFACLYLNDDPSITVFNLARKYIPKEIVNTLSRKPFQNFVWARSTPGTRRLWTITKSNVFVSYDLNSPEETAQNILRPLETLPAVATSWTPGASGLSVVSQDTDDFDMLIPVGNDTPTEPLERPASEDFRGEEDRYFEHQASPASFESSILPNRGLQSSHPSTPTFFYQKNTTMSPKERPLLLRLSTQHSQPVFASSLGLQRSNLTDLSMAPASLRPSLNRNPSQTTVESVSLGGTVYQPVLSYGSHHGSAAKPQFSSSPSPYLVSMSLPLPSADDAVFATLANDYLTDIPDAFTLSFVCQINARVAASVQRFRDCQTWRMIAVALEQDESKSPGPPAMAAGAFAPETEAARDHTSLDVLSRSPQEEKSISSDLGNVVGSYNSNSTLTTNYGNHTTPRSAPIYCKGPNNRTLGSSRDLDDENLHILTNASASLSSSAFSAGTDNTPGSHLQGLSLGSRDSQAGSWQSLGSKNFPKPARNIAPHSEQRLTLDRVEESSIKSKEVLPSQLTKAMSRYGKEDSLFRPWHAVNIIKKSLEYALAQGDLVMSATLILLFHGHFQQNHTEDILGKNECLEVLGLYIESLRSKQLYTIAVQVVKDSPMALKESLSAYAVKEVEMRFYCCWCKTLLTNESSKEKYGVDNERFGFWYCDACSRKQLNCVYCNEPCKGLTLVESLQCGHRGHFGCLQEWHLEEGNVECPGGCD
ncbi:hypothetical protein METBIDRAFT_42681 [Metschnikowia bicuspidata var. bicuspidata NRRL YB-4993]|uniref:Restriction of telomere capping protein 1 n=1 Tax=Metschnikowia bicuspidata var. bicuspidata NRRL YB-4993 TaxID=869754 RepID=A0A1A0HAR7_9ASCO|nr:hypothetical protein METBIDRAFT_42681 [Metschnikowia bicuspidata var. bicuspidata NRRL YB-4993]OBA20978.1 hypothetical protein METBIDRAFT_42681 [Metschnikowia bicuspidata var. bicuspidata NRRL YB-4993]